MSLDYGDLLVQRAHSGFRLQEPERHRHRSIEFNRCEKFEASLSKLLGLSMDVSEPQMTMCLQRTHPQFSSQTQRLCVVGLSLLSLQRTTPTYKISSNSHYPCPTPFIVSLMRHFQPMPSKRLSGLRPTR